MKYLRGRARFWLAAFIIAINAIKAMKSRPPDLTLNNANNKIDPKNR